MSPPVTTPAALLASVFGFSAFRPGQEEIVEAVCAGRDVLAIMPTGGGKSLCFQLPALVRDGLTVVISPLIALMRDQVRALQEAGVAAGAITSGNTEEETEAVWQAIDDGALKLLYIAPERLASTGTERMLRPGELTLIAVDEAHCVSQWGHDFRPDYLRIGELRRTLGVPLAAFTATADAETRAEIASRLFEHEPEVFLHGFDRPNITLTFEPKDRPRRQILSFAAARKGQSGIVYCGTRAKTEALAKALRDDGHAACHYHGGMEADDRREVERRFQQEDGLIVVATVAFGMGIDKPDIRWVAHADLPKSIECVLSGDRPRGTRRGARRHADAVRRGRHPLPPHPDRRGAGAAGDAAGRSRPAQRASGAGGGAGLPPGGAARVFRGDDGPCGNCDLCEKPPELFDATTEVRKALSAMLRTEERFGTGHLIDVLTGTSTEKTGASATRPCPPGASAAMWASRSGRRSSGR